MNREDVIRIAREARLAEHTHPYQLWSASDDGLERFAALVAAAALKNSVMTDEDQRMRLTFDAEVIEMVKEAVEMEREACANLLLSTDLSGLRNDLVLQNWIANLLVNYAAAIRARGQG
jgi:hypothetical protein